MSDLPILDIADSQVGPELDAALRKLLFTCFAHEPQLQTQRYVLEPPAHRFYIQNSDGSLRAHAAVHRKKILVGGNEIEVGGVAEVAVDPAYRGRGYARALVQRLHQWLQQQRIPYSMLFGVGGIYRSSGYRPLTARVRYQDRAGNPIEEMNPVAMICELGDQPWPEGLAEIRGPLF